GSIPPGSARGPSARSPRPGSEGGRRAMARASVFLSGIRASGRHGANPGEQLEAQEFVIDLVVTLDVDGDSLDDTVDYRALVEAARAAVGAASFQLLETLAAQVARSAY